MSIPEATSSDSINPLSLSSPSSGNVLVLLNTLYTSGFAHHSPNVPLLSGRTMHTLYAISFIVYSVTDLCDWLFVYFTLRGYVTSFPLKTWLVVSLVTTTVFGSMLTSLLLVLCVENAFAHRLDVTPYRSGFAVIYEAFVQWIQAFNNFRIAFLFMVLHDMPLTILNFLYITSCRCAGPYIYQWPLMMSISVTIVCVLWRLVMLYFAYRRMICPLKSSRGGTFIRQPTLFQQLKLNLSQKFCSQGFHWIIFILSLLLTLILFVLNAILLSSVHGFGSNQIAFEISHAISTRIVMEYENDRQNPRHTLNYDYVLLKREDQSRLNSVCIPGNETNWKFLDEINELPWPYFAACDRSWTIEWSALIDCNLHINKHNSRVQNDDPDYIFI
ncbi:unnamed protein product [Thelazia callipaeda]|uniref:G-protein coupled receptors family 1 profile domain-containing protein n=1 Tax=Thelazia callipaeda TaxID=103827 RepID=A0A0N5DBW3_THECL|nr:unnamed protein product [Thelazia callipaeda]